MSRFLTDDLVKAVLAHVEDSPFTFTGVASTSGDSFDDIVELDATGDDNADVERWLNADHNAERDMLQPEAFFGAFIETSHNRTSALVGDSGRYYVLDSHRNDVRTGLSDGKGRAIVVEIVGLQNLFRYLRSLLWRAGYVKLSMVHR